MGDRGDDRARLREALEVGATAAEVEEFIRKNRRNMAPDCEGALRSFTPLEQRHIMRRGDLPPNCCEPILCKRLKESKQMARQLSGLVDQSARRGHRRPDTEAEADARKPMAFMPGYENAISMCQVSAGESRFASAAAGGAAAVASAEDGEAPKEGTVCGVGGVIEIVKRKFGCDPGTRLRVLGEKGNLWQCEGGVGIVKFQLDGWRWVLRADIAQAQVEAQRQKDAKTQKGKDERDRAAKQGEAKASREARRADGHLRGILALQKQELQIAHAYNEKLRIAAQTLEDRVEKELQGARAAKEAKQKQAKQEARQETARMLAMKAAEKAARNAQKTKDAKKKEKEKEKAKEKGQSKEKEAEKKVKGSKRKASAASSAS